jgi:hypothetical protein
LQNKTAGVLLLSVDAFFALSWLSSMGSNAKLLGSLNVPVHCVASYNDGEAFNSNHCITKRTNYNLVVGPTGKAILGALIALSFLEM